MLEIREIVERNPLSTKLPLLMESPEYTVLMVTEDWAIILLSGEMSLHQPGDNVHCDGIHKRFKVCKEDLFVRTTNETFPCVVGLVSMQYETFVLLLSESIGMVIKDERQEYVYGDIIHNMQKSDYFFVGDFVTLSNYK